MSKGFCDCNQGRLPCTCQPEQAARAALAQPSPAPEVVGYCDPSHIQRMKADQISGFMVHDEQSDYICESLMAVAQYGRVVGEMRAAHQLTLDELHAMEVHIAQAGRDIDAAQARVAELEKQEPVAEIVQREPFEDGSANPCKAIQWKGQNAEDDFPAGTKLYAAPVAQAGQVPDWVACAERLPESGEPVIVWCSGSNQAGVAWIRQGAWLMPEPQALGYESITHWAPLPAAPQPAKGSDDATLAQPSTADRLRETLNVHGECIAKAATLAQQATAAKAALTLLVAFADDVLPQIGKLCIQDYNGMNAGLILARQILKEEDHDAS